MRTNRNRLMKGHWLERRAYATGTKIVIILGLLIVSCSGDKKQNQETLKKVNLWDKQQEDEFVKTNSLTDFDKFYYTEIMDEYKHAITYEKMLDTLENKEFRIYLKTNKKQFLKSYKVDMSKIAGKSRKEVENTLGPPNKKEKVKPSKTPCPCDKLNYLDNLVEILYINGVADWITVNNSKNYVDIGNRINYQSIDQFDDYTYVKVKTR